MATAAVQSQQHLLAIAQRNALSEQVTDVLVERGDREVVRSVAQNNGARFSNAAFKTLVERSVGDDVLAVHVGTRHDLPRQHLLRLVEYASPAVRQKLAAADPAAAAAIRDVIAEIGGNIRAASRRASSDYAAARVEVEAMHRAGRLDEQQVYGFADARKFEETAVALSLMTGAPIDLVERAMLDDNPDMVGDPGEDRGFLLEHRAMHPAARGKPLAVGAGSRSRAVGIFAAQAKHRPQHHRVLRCAASGQRDARGRLAARALALAADLRLGLLVLPRLSGLGAA